MSFSNKWIKPQNEIGNVGMKLLENIKPPSPLKPRIEEAQKRLHSQISKLESMSAKMDEKDQIIFKRIISAMQNHDSQYAKILSNELSQIRKMNKMITSAKLALEQIQLRLNTITESFIMPFNMSVIFPKDCPASGIIEFNPPCIFFITDIAGLNVTTTSPNSVIVFNRS